MAVITGIKTGVKIVRLIGQRYKYLDINRKFIRKYVPPGYRRQAEIVSDVLITGGALYQAVNYINSAFQKTTRKYNNQRQTRDYMVKSRTRRKQYNYCPPHNRYSTKRY